MIKKNDMENLARRFGWNLLVNLSKFKNFTTNGGNFNLTLLIKVCTPIRTLDFSLYAIIIRKAYSIYKLLIKIEHLFPKNNLLIILNFRAKLKIDRSCNPATVCNGWYANVIWRYGYWWWMPKGGMILYPLQTQYIIVLHWVLNNIKNI